MKRKPLTSLAGNQPAAKKRKLTQTMTRRKTISLVGVAPELKFNDVAFVTDATTTGSVVSLNNFAAGDTNLLRDGNRIKMKSIQLRFTLENEALNQNNAVRMMIVYDKQTNLTAPTIATAGTGPLDTITIQSLRQVATVSRFKILCDRVYVINSTSDTAGALQIIHDEIFVKIPLDSQDVAYGSGGATEPVSGGLYLMYFGNVAAGAGDVNVLGQARLRFWG